MEQKGHNAAASHLVRNRSRGRTAVHQSHILECPGGNPAAGKDQRKKAEVRTDRRHRNKRRRGKKQDSPGLPWQWQPPLDPSCCFEASPAGPEIGRQMQKRRGRGGWEICSQVFPTQNTSSSRIMTARASSTFCTYLEGYSTPAEAEVASISACLFLRFSL